MIPTRGNYVAIIRHDGRERCLRVEAWNDEGEPMVIDPGESKGLVAATTIRGFARVEENPEARSVFLPGGDWVMEKDGEVLPIVGWAVSDDAITVPIAIGYPGAPVAEIHDEVGYHAYRLSDKR
jgi:hypothetical protein